MPKKPVEATKRDQPASLHPVPSEEAVADLLKVKKPEVKTKPKKPQTRERRKRSI